jgi:hypothetical protein
MARRLGWLILLLALLCGMGLAQGVVLDSTPPSRAQVLSLMSAMGVQQSVDTGLRNTQHKIKLAARNSFLKKNPDADAETLKKLDAVFDTTPLFSFDEISEPVIAVYQKHLSASDVQAGIDFYTSDAGKRMLAQLPVISRETNESGGLLVQSKLKAYSEEINRKLEAFQSEVDKQKPPAANSKAADEKSKTDDKSK